jgi:REP element-mobilizing transposase RayT
VLIFLLHPQPCLIAGEAGLAPTSTNNFSETHDLPEFWQHIMYSQHHDHAPNSYRRGEACLAHIYQNRNHQMNQRKSEFHNRKSIRLLGYDYSQLGAYFVTICVHNRKSLFGQIVNSEMTLNNLGLLAETAWMDLPNHFSSIEVDTFIVMPNHTHGIIIIRDTRNIISSSPRPSLASIVGSYKATVSRNINRLRQTPDAQVWQRNYYQHIIRDNKELHDIRHYIVENPASWAKDRVNPLHHADT